MHNTFLSTWWAQLLQTLCVEVILAIQVTYFVELAFSYSIRPLNFLAMFPFSLKITGAYARTSLVCPFHHNAFGLPLWGNSMSCLHDRDSSTVITHAGWSRAVKVLVHVRRSLTVCSRVSLSMSLSAFWLVTGMHGTNCLQITGQAKQLWLAFGLTREATVLH